MYHIHDDPQLTCDAITADFRIYQRRQGHRYSLDDLATAWEAAAAAPAAARVLDMGCGIGSVTLMLAWRLPRARIWGIEALPMSAHLARQNLALNHLDARVTVLDGDLRDVTTSWPHERCDLVTGTPPYLPEGTALASPDPQRAAARIELRGGVEDYLLAGAKVLADAGVLVVCADGRKPERVVAGAQAAGLHPHRRRDVWPSTTAPHPLFAVWTLARQPAEMHHDNLTIRGEDGEQTPAAHALRHSFGL